MSDIDALLYRNIKDGKEFDPLIPKTTCQPTVLGKGMTDFSVSEMAKIVKKYYGQLSKVAPLLHKSSLQQTCNVIHKWTYDHFQYKADKETQFLRSPSCSWYCRYEGIDCKSYSILASSILVNLGITHYIRRIKQPGFMPDLWTHVYVIVPIDQKTGRLTKGYYTIDGTVATQDEPIYIDKSDLLMSMQHIGLNGVHNQGLGLSIGDVKKYFSNGWSPNCIGGTYDRTHFDKAMASIVPAFDDMFYNVNQSIRYGDNLIQNINKVLRVSAQLKDHSARKAGGNWKSNCTKDALNAYKDLSAYYANIVATAFMPWLQTYFDITTGTQSIANNTFEFEIGFDKGGSDVATITVPTITSIKPKATTSDVKSFVVTPYVAEKTSTGGFNFGTFLQGLTQVAASFDKNGSNNGTGSNTGTGQYGYDPATGKPYDAGNNIKTAGAGIVGFVLLAAGASLVFANMKDNPAKPAGNTPKATTPKKTIAKK